MNKKFNIFVMLAIIAGIYVICVTCRYGYNWYLIKCDKNATLLFDDFSIGCHFDAIEVAHNGEVSLFEYAESNCSSFVLVKKHVETVLLDAMESKALTSFSDIKEYCGGLFFATSINWSGEWSGIYITQTLLPSHLEDYVSYDMRNGHYWVDVVPDHIIVRDRS